MNDHPPRSLPSSPGAPTTTTTTGMAAGSPTALPVRKRREKRLGPGPDVVYCEDDRIGQGQFGTVYRGTMGKSHEVVAVKLFRDTAVTPLQSQRTTRPTPSRATGEGEEDGEGEGEREGEVSSPSAAAATAAAAAAMTTDSPTTSPATRSTVPPEIEVLWRLRSEKCPNILYVHSLWNSRNGDRRSSAGRAFIIVSEYCAGGDLQHYLFTKGKVPEMAARSLMYQLANALHLLKHKNIIHRDIKPANLLLTDPNPAKAVLKVADMGMATMAKPRSTSTGRHAHSSASEQQKQQDLVKAEGDVEDEGAASAGAARYLARSGLFHSVLGTPMYMSPERTAGLPYGYKADVYSAGMVLYEMITGTRVRATVVSQLRTAVPDAIERERIRCGSNPAPLWLDLLQGMTRPDPSQRLSIEDVLRHPWFAPNVGPPLPPLTIPLPSTSSSDSPASAPTTESRSDTAHTEGTVSSGHPSQLPPTQTHTALPRDEGRTREGAGEPSTNSTSSPTLTSSPQQPTAAPLRRPSAPPIDESIVVDVPTSTTAEQQPHSPPTLSSLAAGSTAATASTAPAAGAAAVTGGAVQPSLCTLLAVAHPKAAAATAAASLSAPSGSSWTLPEGCGPHLITHAIRAYVDCVVSEVLLAESDPAKALVLISYLAEMIQNGYAAYVWEIELMGMSSTGAAQPNAAATNPQTTSAGGGREGQLATTVSSTTAASALPVVSHSYGALQDIWHALMQSITSLEATWAVRLPRQLAREATACRRRLQYGADVDGDGNRNALARGEHGGGEGTESARREGGEEDGGESILWSTAPSAHSVDGGEAVEASAITTTPPATADAAHTAGNTLSTTDGGGGGGGGSIPSRSPVLYARAEALIFDRAIHLIQSAALSELLTPQQPSSTQTVPPGGIGQVEEEPPLPSLLEEGGPHLSTCMDELEEEQEHACSEKRRTDTAMPFAHVTGTESAAREDVPSHGSVFSPTDEAFRGYHQPPPQQPQHEVNDYSKAIALLRVLLQQVVVTEKELGVWFVVDCPPTPWATSKEASAALQVVEQWGQAGPFLCRVPVFQTLPEADLVVVDSALQQVLRHLAQRAP